VVFSLADPSCEMLKAMAMVLQAITTKPQRDLSAGAAAFKALRLLDQVNLTPGDDDDRLTRVVKVQMLLDFNPGKLPNEIEAAVDLIAGIREVTNA
jgi:hypothetical protein